MKSLEVSIAGYRLPIRTQASKEDVQEAVELVESRLRNVLGTKSLISNQSLLLTSLILADEIIRQKRELCSFKQSIRSRSEAILDRLDREFLAG